MPDAELFTTYTEVKPEWIDYNGHMNMGYYLVAFDHVVTDMFFDSMNIGVAQKQALGKSTFALSANIDFIREVMVVTSFGSPAISQTTITSVYIIFTVCTTPKRVIWRLPTNAWACISIWRLGAAPASAMNRWSASSRNWTGGSSSRYRMNLGVSWVSGAKTAWDPSHRNRETTRRTRRT